jgi:hypothetical protein
VDSRDGDQLEIVWPYGFSARFNPALELLNEQGEVVARDGDVLDLGGAARSVASPNGFYACTVTRASADQGLSWGPLAVMPSPLDMTDVSRVDAIVRITASCVFLETSGVHILPIWAADRTTWSAELRAIAFDEGDGRVVIARDGDFRAFFSTRFSPAESGVSWDAWVAGVDWVAPPAPSCRLDSVLKIDQMRY